MPALRSYNKVILVGNLTRDPELRYTASNTPIGVFTVATNRVWTNANGERNEEASFHRVNVWGKQAESLAKILHKGIKVLVEGILVYREVRDDSGKMLRREARIRAESVVILDKKGASGSSATVAPESSDNGEDVQDAEAVLNIDGVAAELGAKDDASDEKAGAKDSKESEEDKSDDIDESDLPF